MTEVEQKDRGLTASRGEGIRSRVRGWFAPTGAPPAWALVRYLICGLAVGAAFGLALPDFRGTLLAALTGAVVAASGVATYLLWPRDREAKESVPVPAT